MKLRLDLLYEIFSQGSTNLQTHEDQRKDQRSCFVFAYSKHKTCIVAINNFYSGVTAGTAAISKGLQICGS